MMARDFVIDGSDGVWTRLAPAAPSHSSDSATYSVAAHNALRDGRESRITSCVDRGDHASG